MLLVEACGCTFFLVNMLKHTLSHLYCTSWHTCMLRCGHFSSSTSGWDVTQNQVMVVYAKIWTLDWTKVLWDQAIVSQVWKVLSVSKHPTNSAYRYFLLTSHVLWPLEPGLSTQKSFTPVNSFLNVLWTMSYRMSLGQFMCKNKESGCFGKHKFTSWLGMRW